MTDLSSVVMGVSATPYHIVPPVWPHQKNIQVYDPDPVHVSPHKITWGGAMGLGASVACMNAPITDPPFVFYLTAGAEVDLYFYDADTLAPVELSNIDLKFRGKSTGDGFSSSWPTMAISAPKTAVNWHDRDDNLSSRTIQMAGDYDYFYVGPDAVVSGDVFREYEAIRSFLPNPSSSLRVRLSTAICWKCFSHYGPGYYEQAGYDLHNRPYDSFTAMQAGLLGIELLGFTPDPPDPPMPNDRRRRAAWVAGARVLLPGSMSGEMRGI